MPVTSLIIKVDVRLCASRYELIMDTVMEQERMSERKSCA